MARSMDDGLVAHVLDMLRDWGGVSARRMFSGYGLFRQGAMFGLIARDTLYLRVDDRNRPEFAAAGSRVFSYRRGGIGRSNSAAIWNARRTCSKTPTR
ncbi:MAG TPA: TfoX/Sxy family protein [Stellaceae bacterium]|nr:TfoX/Sxy family protein [Stellaceae bacterium]